MTGVMQLLNCIASGIVRLFTAWNVSADSAPGVLATATFNVNSDGSISWSATNNDNSTPGTLNWYKPSVAGVGTNFWVRFTATSGTLTTNGAATFTQLNANRSVTKSSTASAASCTFTVEIASDSGGTNIVATYTGNVVGYTHT